MSRKNHPAPIIAANAFVDDACDWLTEVLKGGLNPDIIEIALDQAQESLLDAQQTLLSAAYTTEAVATNMIDGQEFVEYREVVANRLALKALELLNWRTEALMQALQTQSPVRGVIDRKWILGTRKLLPEFCDHGFSAPLQREELPRTAAGEPGLAGLCKWIFGRGGWAPSQV